MFHAATPAYNQPMEIDDEEDFTEEEEPKKTAKPQAKAKPKAAAKKPTAKKSAVRVEDGEGEDDAPKKPAYE
jgi:hypothetical protein